jgi:hypothetical protein
MWRSRSGIRYLRDAAEFRTAEAKGGGEGWSAVYRRLMWDLDGPIDAGEAASTAICRICDAIRAIAPTSLAGLAVHAETLAYSFREADIADWDGPPDAHEFQPRRVKDYVEHVRRLAGAVS